MRNPRYGSSEIRANVEAGRYTRMAPARVQRLDPDQPFRHINSGEPAVLANGDLELDLSAASLNFPNGRDNGDVLVQFLLRGDVPYQAAAAANPHWLYGFQPRGIQLSGRVGLSLAMPPLYGSYAYLPADGQLVLLVGYNSAEQRLVPVGVGHIDNRRVLSEGAVALPSLDYLGYVIIAPEQQAILGRYRDGVISLERLLAELGG
jgi:hypothetical protein